MIEIQRWKKKSGTCPQRQNLQCFTGTTWRKINERISSMAVSHSCALPKYPGPQPLDTWQACTFCLCPSPGVGWGRRTTFGQYSRAEETHDEQRETLQASPPTVTASSNPQSDDCYGCYQPRTLGNRMTHRICTVQQSLKFFCILFNLRENMFSKPLRSCVLLQHNLGLS